MVPSSEEPLSGGSPRSSSASDIAGVPLEGAGRQWGLIKSGRASKPVPALQRADVGTSVALLCSDSTTLELKCSVLHGMLSWRTLFNL